MTNTLRAKIALDGADDVRKQLDALGQSGKQAFQQISGATRQASAGTSQISAAFGQLVSAFSSAAKQIRDIGAGLGAAFDPLLSAAGSASETLGKTGAALGAIAGAAAGVSRAIAKIGQEAANSIAKLNDAAEAVGLTLEKFRALQAGAQGVGLPANALTDAAKQADEIAGKIRTALTTNGIEGQNDDGSYSSGLARQYGELQKLGVSVLDSSGQVREGASIIRDAIQGLSTMGDETERANRAVAIFGDTIGKSLGQAAAHRDELERTSSGVASAGAAFSDAQKRMILEARRSGVELEAVKQSWKDYFTALATPVAIEQNHSILTFLDENKRAIKDFGDNVLGPAIVWLGQLKNAFGVTAISAGLLGSALGVIGPVGAVGFGALGAAAILFGDQIKNGAIAAMTELTRIVQTNDLSTFQGWKTAASEVWIDIKTLATEAWTNLKEEIRNTDWRAVWENVKVGALAAWEGVKAAAIDAYDTIKSSALSAFPELTGPWNDLEVVAKGAWSIVKQIILGIPDAFRAVMKVANEVADAVNAVFGTHFTGATLLATALIVKFGSSLLPIPGWLQAIAVVLAPVSALFTVFATTVRAGAGAIDFVLGKIQALADGLENRLSAALRKLVGEDIWDGMRSAAKAALDAIASALNSVAAAARSAWAAITGKPATSQSSASASNSSGIPTNDNAGGSNAQLDGTPISRSWTPGYARGGTVSGAGTSTSDSIFARLSNGEFVMNARAVGYWGADLFHALNNLAFPGFASGGAASDAVAGGARSDSCPAIFAAVRAAVGSARNSASPLFAALADAGNAISGNVSAVQQFARGGLVGTFPAFAMGGVVGAPTPISIPAFATGGMASSPSHAGLIAFTLDQGGRSYELMGSKDAVRDLQRQSVISRMSSTTKRAPSWRSG